MQSTSVDLVFLWVMVFIAFAVGMLCKSLLAREERREARAKLDEAARIVGEIHGLVMLGGMSLPAAVVRRMRNIVGESAGMIERNFITAGADVAGDRVEIEITALTAEPVAQGEAVDLPRYAIVEEGRLFYLRRANDGDLCKYADVHKSAFFAALIADKSAAPASPAHPLARCRSLSAAHRGRLCWSSCSTWWRLLCWRRL